MYVSSREIYMHYNTDEGHAKTQLFEALCYKLEGCGFDSP